MSNKVSVQWRAYPMDKLGIKSSLSGVVKFNADTLIIRVIHDEVNELVRQEHPELSSTPILIGKVQKEFK